MSQGALSWKDLIYRPLTPADEAQVRELCSECFPISYPDRWFAYITSDRVFSLSAWTGTPVGSGCGQTGIGCGLVGMVVGEVQELEQLEGEGGVALERSEVNTKAMYIISLGVTERYRRRGVGNHLMTSLLDHVTSSLPDCWAVYLHVLASNTTAIEFYHRLSFCTLTCIPGYYIISQRPQDGLLLIRYVNQGEPFSHSLAAYMRRYVSETAGCRVVTALCQGVVHWVGRTVANSSRTEKHYP